MRLGKSALVHFSSQVVISIAGFAGTFAIAYMLGSEGLGRYSIAVALGYFWLSIPTNAVGMAVTKRMSEGVHPARFFSSGLAINVVLAVAIAILVVLVGQLLEGIRFGGEFAVVLTTYEVEIAALVICSAGFNTAIQAIHGQQRVGTAGMLQAVERLGRSSLQILLLLAGMGVAAISLGFAASLALTAILVVIVSRIPPVTPDFEKVSSLLAYARYAWGSTLTGRVFGWLDTIVLSVFVSASLVGIYEAAWGIASLLALASASISQTLFPEVSELSVGENFEQIKHYLDEAIAFSGLFIIPGFLGALVLGDRVLTFYRPEFGRGTGVLLILIVAYGANVYGMQFLNVVNAIDRPDAALRVNAVFVGLNLVLNVGLVWYLGWYGAAIATASSATLRAALGALTLSRLIGELSIPYEEMLRQLLAGILMAAIVSLVVPYAPHRRVGTLLLVALGGGIYLVSLIGLSRRFRAKASGLSPVQSGPLR